MTKAKSEWLLAVNDTDIPQSKLFSENVHQEVHVVHVFRHEGLKITAAGNDLNLKIKVKLRGFTWASF